MGHSLDNSLGNSLIEKVASYSEAKNMIENGDLIVAGVSGGADSVCLLFLLCEFRKRFDLKLHVVHVNHGIRKSADRDEEFVKALCERLEVPFTAVFEDVPALAAKLHLSEEEAGRKVRYEAFEECARKMAFEYSAEEDRVKIAVAHNMNDNAETVLFRMFRGTGIKGMAGIPASNGGRRNVIRPLLCLERREIEEFLRERDISWVEDETNDLDIYSRNRIRHNILPEAEEIVPEAARHIAALAGQMEETEDLLSSLEEEAFDKCVKEQNAAFIRLEVERLGELHIALQKRVLHRALRILSAGGKDLGTLQIDQLLDLAGNPLNRKADLARGIFAVREYGDLCIYGNGNAGDNDAEGGTLKGSPNSAGDFELLQERFSLEEMLKEDPDFIENLSQNADSNKYTKWFDYDKINGWAVLRNRQPGDYFLTKKPDGTFGKKSLKEYMIDRKIPPSERENILLAAADEKILWIVGYRISDDLKVSDSTVNLVRFTLKKK